MSTTNTIRVTKSQKLDGVIALLEGKSAIVLPGKDDKLGVTLDAAYLIDFCKAEQDLLKRKNTTADGTKKKLTPQQKKNETFKAAILAYMSATPDKVFTAQEMMDNFLRPTYPTEIWSSQRAASLLTALSDKIDKDTQEVLSRGKLERVPGRGKINTTFQIRPEAIVDLEEGDTETAE